MSDTESHSTEVVDADEMAITTQNGDPAIELPSGQVIRLEAVINTAPNARIDHEVDVEDGWRGAGWNIHPETTNYPSVTIRPHLSKTDE